MHIRDKYQHIVAGPFAFFNTFRTLLGQIQRGGGSGPDPMESHNLCFFRKTGTDPPQEAIGHSRGGPYRPL